MPPVSQRYRESRRQQVLDGARRCFARTGFHGASMQDVFDETGLSAGAVYGYFKSKEDLIAAIIDQVLDEVTETITSSPEAPGTLDDPGELPHRMLAVLGHLDNGRDLARLAVAVWAEAVRNPELNERLASRYRRMRTEMARRIRSRPDHGILAPGVDPEAIAQVLVALGPAFLTQRALFDDVTVESFVRGLRGLGLDEPAG